MASTSRITKSRDTLFFNTLGFIFVSLFALFCLIPFVMLVAASFTSEHAILNYGFQLIPREYSLDAYQLLFKYPQDIIRAYGVTIFITVTGSLIGLFVVSMTAYVLSRKDFLYKNKLAFYFYFVTLFNGGLVATYIIMIRYYHLKNSMLVLILPYLVNIFYLIIMRSFMTSIPDSLGESAKIDGANDFLIFIRIILPLSKPALATIGLFIALDYWNDWYNAMLYLTNYKIYPLQYVLYNMLASQEAMARLSKVANLNTSNMPMQSIKMAMSVIATGPILLVYPFVQKYFIKGITVGAVKG
jgi:putative aldouronate transport system permease protein